MYKVVGLIVALILVVGGVVFVVSRNNDNNDQTETTSQPATTPADSTPPASQSTPKKTANVITYDGSNFSPSKLTVNSGDKITIKNASSVQVGFYSDPHPVHTDNPELNAGMINAGKSATITVTTTGTWGYHNHLDASQAGTIVVK